MSLLGNKWFWLAALAVAIVAGGAVGYIRHQLNVAEKLKLEAQAREDYIEELIAARDAMQQSQKIKVKNEQAVKGKSHNELVSVLAGKQWLRND